MKAVAILAIFCLICINVEGCQRRKPKYHRDEEVIYKEPQWGIDLCKKNKKNQLGKLMNENMCIAEELRICRNQVFQHKKNKDLAEAAGKACKYRIYEWIAGKAMHHNRKLEKVNDKIIDLDKINLEESIIWCDREHGEDGEKKLICWGELYNRVAVLFLKKSHKIVRRGADDWFTVDPQFDTQYRILQGVIAAVTLQNLWENRAGYTSFFTEVTDAAVWPGTVLERPPTHPHIGRIEPPQRVGDFMPSMVIYNTFIFFSLVFNIFS